MMYQLAVLLLSCCFGALGLNTNKFPDNFNFGVATASYQVEGGWNDDGKGENIWDYFSHNFPYFFKNHDNGDVSCDSYHKYEEDVKMMKDLGVQYYRFSLSWARILPNGLTNYINQAGVDYYKKLIKLLKANNIEPLVTLYHWDLPLYLFQLGGWGNPEVTDYFADYAKVAFTLFGDDVKMWLTFNEPDSFCVGGYVGTDAPFYNASGFGSYICAYNMLKAHAKAYHIYHEELRLDGRVSITLSSEWGEPASNKTKDIEAAETYLNFELGLYAHPIYIGNYPQIVIDNVAKRSKLEGFKTSRLIELTKEEINYIKGSSDFFALNTYSTNLVKFSPKPIGEPQFYNDANATTYKDPSWPKTSLKWLTVVPWGVRKILNWIKNNYNNPEIIVTENGVCDSNGTLEDNYRVDYYRQYLSNILDAIYEDGVNVTGYFAWSLMDNLEWAEGFTQKFGLYRVDFNDPNRTRTIKKSGEYYRKIIKNRSLLELNYSDIPVVYNL